ncbi:MAG: magnesium transporter [Candidatus Cloacimonetes bacterium]|nr:magnesium transporter [Candidatus Cloacimonadota bacterium]
MLQPAGEIRLPELADAWWLLDQPDRIAGFRLLEPGDAEEFFFDLTSSDQAELLLALTPAERRLWLRLLPPDDAADLIQEAPEEDRPGLLGLLDEATRREVTALLAYEEDEAGGLMSSRFARVRPDMTADEAISYLRKQAQGRTNAETLYYIYVLDSAQRLLGVLSFRELFAAPGNRTVREIMRVEDMVTVPEEMDQEAVARLFAEYDVLALPVVDDQGRMKGIVTVDDIVDVVEEEATEDIHKYGGLEALDEPYLRIGFFDLVRKRAPWLVILFFGGMLTATAVGRFEDFVTTIKGLAVFMPLVIASGGNSGSQASTLVIRAMTVGEVRLRDWWRVVRRELGVGLVLGLLLAVLGIGRVWVASLIGQPDNADTILFAVTIAAALVGVVVFGTLVGSMLPFILRRLGFDPASASAPLVATLVDVSGLLIYFWVASSLLT